MSVIDKLKPLRQAGPVRTTLGLSDDIVERFVSHDDSLIRAIRAAEQKFSDIVDKHQAIIALEEGDQVAQVQTALLNFYPDDQVNPYVAIAGCGPWLVTLKGAVLHDSGGYGMIGLGHAPASVLQAMNQKQAMANVMTPSLSQLEFFNLLKHEIGRPSSRSCPFSQFIALNSGSESVAMAARLSDINAKQHTDPGGRYEGQVIKMVALKGAFHGRTQRPAFASHSTQAVYNAHLASFRDRNNLVTVPPNDIDALESVFTTAKREHFFIEAMFMEPVMGEGNPGLAITADFYNCARRLTQDHDALLLIDSIQAGLRAHGVLSIVDYPGFEKSTAPDMETYSKALNAGQFPLSILAMNERAAKLYRKGVYGNTMTANPRALDVGQAVLRAVDESVRRNIVRAGAMLKEKLEHLAQELGDAIIKVQGTGLLVSCELNGERYQAFGAGSTEEYLRRHGIGIIHGGQNSLRLTPHFNISEAEIVLIIDRIRDALVDGPKISFNTTTTRHVS